MKEVAGTGPDAEGKENVSTDTTLKEVPGEAYVSLKCVGAYGSGILRSLRPVRNLNPHDAREVRRPERSRRERSDRASGGDALQPQPAASRSFVRGIVRKFTRHEGALP